MVVRSQNGWPAVASTKGLTRFEAAGAGWWAANADVATVFTRFIERFVALVEPIAGPVKDDWSYANRLIRGSTTVVSNHGSATAIDLNALQHPRGVHNTFTAAEQKIMHRIRDEISDDAGRPVLRLGMDFETTVDDMHVEVNASPGRVREAAEKIRNEEAMMQINPDDKDQWPDHKLTATDAAAIGGDAQKGNSAAWSALFRFPPAIARLRREVLAGFQASAKAHDVTSVAAAVAELDGKLDHLTGALDAFIASQQTGGQA